MNVFLVLLAMGACLTPARLETSQDKNFQQAQEIESHDLPAEEEPLRTTGKRIEDIPGLTEDMLVETIEEAKKETQEDEAKTPRVQQIDSEEQSHQMTHYRRFAPELEPVRINALVKERTVKKLAEKLGMSHKEAANALEGLEDRNFKAICKSTPPESVLNRVPHGYRSIDGRRNNNKNPEFGRVNTPFTRLLPPDYSDGISNPRKTANGRQDLPNARKVSIELFKDKNRPSSTMSHMAMIWGQFINHDTSRGIQPNIDCSKSCGLKGECFGIPIPPGDKAFLDKNRTCIVVKRDGPSCGSKTTREQLNTRTAFLDATNVYSADPKKFISLRDPSDQALLEEMKNPQVGLKSFLSKQSPGGVCRIPDSSNRTCFKAGDFRNNENPGLASMHTIWNREHNRMAKELRKINPHWNADQLFFETRKILGAMMQHITYNEYLPSILNFATRRRFNLILQRMGHFWGYDDRVNPGIINAFVSAAFRFGHSQVQNLLGRFGEGYHGINPAIRMEDSFLNPIYLYQSKKGGLDSIVRGLVKERSQNVDRFFSKAVTEGLKRKPGDLGDLAAINIQRAREHGIPSYNEYRQHKIVGLKKAKDFDDLKADGYMDDDKIKQLKDVYAHVQDIDLFVGGLFEKPLPGGSVGPTFSAIVAEQFKRMRIGDSFWYENPGEFTYSQLREIRKVTLARLICDNTDGIKKIQKYVIRSQPSRLRSCFGRKRLPGINLRKWKMKGTHD